MTTIERRVEITGRPEPDYGATQIGEQEVASRKHRRFVGGKWEQIGRLQLDFLTEQGLRPEHRFLDVGCGSLRAGRHLVDHLDPGNYFGLDINPEVIEAGYDHELDDAQRAKLPPENLRSTDRFDADFGVGFDMAIAQSLFTHVSLNRVRLCLYRVAKVMRPGGRFFVTIFEKPDDFPLDGVSPSGKNSAKYTEYNVYWHYRGDIEWAARYSPWQVRYIGAWGHPRGQRMFELTRT